MPILKFIAPLELSIYIEIGISDHNAESVKTQLLKLIHYYLVVLILTGGVSCSSSSWLERNESEPLDKAINVSEIFEFAKLAEFTYESDEQIQKTYTNLLLAEELPVFKSKYFITKDDSARTLNIAIRGTANVQNALTDLTYQKEKDPRHDIYLHKGFGEATRELYEAIQPHLEPFRQQEYRLGLTGHSLGGAMAVILMMYLLDDNYIIDRVITFGQPKVTNEDGIKKFQGSPVLRVIYDNDPVPLVPPVTPRSIMNGMYRHFGAQTILLRGPNFVYLDEKLASDPGVTSYWSSLGIEISSSKEHDVTEHLTNSLGDHSIAKYVEMLSSKIDESVQVPFKERAAFR